MVVSESNSVAPDLLTTREVAKLLGVGTTSIKRWADSGLLQCVKTPGGHRRFRRDVVEEFMAHNRHQTDGAPPTLVPEDGDSLLELLTNGASTDAVMGVLAARHQELGSWLSVAESIGVVLDELGRAWARGDLTVIQEHIASERLSRALSQSAERIAVRDDSRNCMVMVAEADEHTLGLHLLELCLREAGWNITWAGRKTPIHFACEFVASSKDVDMLAVSASEYSRDAASLADQANRLGQACQKRGIPLLLGGTGLWPDRPGYGRRVRDFKELRRWIEEHPAVVS